jgi:hypothetical protein
MKADYLRDRVSPEIFPYDHIQDGRYEALWCAFEVVAKNINFKAKTPMGVKGWVECDLVFENGDVYLECLLG